MSDKMKNIIFIALDVLFLLLLIVFNVIPQKINITKYDKYKDKIISNLIYDGVIVSQEFVSKYNSKTFSIQIGTYRHFYKDGEVHLRIQNLKTNEFKEILIPAFAFDDRSPTSISFPLKKKHKYLIELSTKGIAKENGFIIYSTKYKNNKNYNLTINGNPKDYNFIIGYSKKTMSKANYWVIALYLSINFCILSLFIKENKRYEKQ